MSGTVLSTSRVSRALRLTRLGSINFWPLFWALIFLILVAPIAIFLLISISPALVGQGPQWVSLTAFRTAFTTTFAQALIDSALLGIVVSVSATALAYLLSWITLRTNSPVRRLLTFTIYGLMITPSYMIAMGWQRLFEPGGVFEVAGLDVTGPRHVLYSPIGVALVLTMKGVPFAYLAISAGMAGLGQQFEDAARTHGASARVANRMNISLLAPSVWSALAVVFAEAVSDFGVAYTLAAAAHFPVATYAIYNAVQAFPVRFDVASAASWCLLGLIMLALFAQSRAMHGRSYRVLSGRSQAPRILRLRPWEMALTPLAGTAFVVIALGVPAFGAVSASMITNLGRADTFSISLSNYTRALHNPEMYQPLLYSASIAAVVATFAVGVAAVCARKLSSAVNSLSARALDLILLVAIALPGIVFAAGYIFTFNLPFWSTLGIQLYGTTFLLGLAYLASGLPSTARLLSGSMSQLQASISEAARVHGASGLVSALTVVAPLLAGPMLSAWQLTFAHVVLELPISQLLYPPGHPPVVVGIDQALAQYDFGGGTAMQVLAMLVALGVVGIVSLLYRLLVPTGWRRIGHQR